MSIRTAMMAAVTQQTPSSTPALWTESELAPVMWLDAMDAADFVMGAGSLIQRWNGPYGANDYSEQVTANIQPSLVAGTYPAVNFAGSKYLTSASSSNYVGGSAYTLITVATPAGSGVSYPRYLIGQSGGSQNNVLHWGAQANTQWRHSHYFNDVDFTTSALEDRRGIWISRFTAPGCDLYENGVLVGTNPTNPPTNTNGTSSLSVGAMGITNHWRGNANMVGIVKRAISDAERIKLEGFLAHRWGLADSLDAGHAHKSGAPTL